MLTTLKALRWTAVALIVASIATGLIFSTYELSEPAAPEFGFPGFSAIAGVLFAAVALLILQRRASHGIGWLLLAVGTFSSVSWGMTAYAQASVLGSQDLPAGEYVAWVASWLWLLVVIPLVGVLPVIYPHGRVRSKRGKAIALLGIPSAILIALGGSTRPGPLPDEQSYAVNPLPIAWLPHDLLEYGGLFLIIAIGIAGATVLFQAYRQGQEIERLQIRWLLTALVFTTVQFAIYVVLYLAGDRALPSSALVAIGFLSIPIALGFAVTRYRLSEIDVVINRAVVYGPLTAVVAGAYVAAVQLSRMVFVAVTGERSESELLIATLVAGAVFWTVRTRMIGLVDRHFKDPREPAKDLAALRTRLRSSTEFIEPSLLSPERVARQVLTTAINAFDARGGEVRLQGLSREVPPIALGQFDGIPAIAVDIRHEGVFYGQLALGPRENGKPYLDVDQAPLAATASALGEVLHAHRMDPVLVAGRDNLAPA